MDISFVLRKIQKSMASVSILAMLTSLVSFAGIASADTFTDVSTSAWYYDYVDQISDASIMSGYDNGYFGPNDSLTRDQAAKVLVLAFDYPVDADYDAGFSDVSSSNTLEDYINTAALYDIVGGYTDADGVPTGVFGSGDRIDRASFAKMVADAAGLDLVSSTGTFSDVSSSAWYSDYVETVYAWSIVDGKTSTTFAPGDSVSRAEASKMTLMGMDPVWRESDEEVVTSEGDLTVEVSSDSPDAMTIPYNATSVELAAWDFTANGGDVTIDNLSIHQYGISTLGTSHQLYLYEGSTRLTSGTTVSSTDNEATFTYNIDIDSGDTRTISVRGDNLGSASATGEVGLELASASKVDAGDATVDGDFALQGAKHSLSTTAAGTLTIEKNGNTDNPQVGQDGATIAKFKLSSATEAAGVEELGLYLAGSLNTADVENFNLYVSGDDAEALATVSAVDDLDVIRFDISGAFDDSDECENSDGYCIAKGGSKSFYVTADFNTGRTDDTVKVYVDQSTDVFARGALYGSGMAVTRTAYNGDTDSADTGSTACDSTTDADCSYSLLEGGDITISSSGPSASDVATNARDVSVLNFSIVSVTDVTFDSFPVSMDTSSDATDGDEGLWQDSDNASNFTDIKIVNTDTGSALFAGVDASVFTSDTAYATVIVDGTDDAIAYHLYTDDFEMSTGEELNLALTMDIRNDSALDNMTFTASLDLGATYPQLKDTNNKTLTNSSVLVPSSPITSKTMTVKTPSLALSLASTPTSGSNVYVKGTDGVPFTGIVFACGDASACRVTDLTLQGSIDDDGNASAFVTGATGTHTSSLSTYVGSVWLEDSDGGIIAASKSVNSSTSIVTYDSMDWNIEAGETAIAYVVGDISSNSFANTDGEDIAFAITSAGNVTVEDTDGNSFSATGTVNTTPSTYVTTSAGGSLTVAVSSSTARENIAVAGTSDSELSSFEFTTTREAFTVTDFSINNRQNGVVYSATSATGPGSYDNNVSSVTVEYEDVDGTTVTDTAYLVDGTATFSGQTLYIDADDSASMTVYADLNSISSSGSSATAGEFVDLSLAYNNFEAIAQGSGETYKADKIDATEAVTSDLDFGTITWTTGSEVFELEGAQTLTVTLGSTNTLVIDNGSGDNNTNRLPVGSLLCVDDGTTAGNCATDEDIFVVTSWPVGTGATDTVTVLAVDNAHADHIFEDEELVNYSLPGTGFHTGTNQMVVYESKPTLALASSTPSGSRSVTASDDAFVFTVAADSQERVQISVANDYPTCTIPSGGPLTGTLSAVETTAALQVDGTGCSGTDITGDPSGLSVGFLAANSTGGAGTVDDYSYISFWFKYHAQGAAVTTVTPARITVGTSDANDGTVDNAATVAASNILGSPAILAEDTWYFFKDIATPAGTDGSDIVIDIGFGAGTGLLNTDDVYFDQVRQYNTKVQVNLASDGDFDQTFGQGSNVIAATLKESGNTVATGYVDFVGVGDADGTDDAIDGTDAATAVITFIPTSTQGVIDIAKDTTKTYTVNLSSIDLLADDGGVDDPLTFTMNYGSSSGGTVTNGDFWWYETNALVTGITSNTTSAGGVRWVGNTSSTSLTGNTVKY